MTKLSPLIGASLPLNPSLASALSTHGVRCNSTNSTNGSTGVNAYNAPSMATSPASRAAISTFHATTRQRTSVVTIHPSLPRVAYLVETSSFAPIMRKKHAEASKAGHLGSSGGQQIVIQQFRRRVRARHSCHPLLGRAFSASSGGGGIVAGNHGATLAVLSLHSLPPALNRFRQPRSKSSKVSQQPLTLAALGPLRSMTFLDREALFWQTRRRHGSLSDPDAANVAWDAANGGNDIVNADQVENAKAGMGHGLCLGLQFARVLVVLRFHTGIASIATAAGALGGTTTGAIHHAESTNFIILCCLEGQRTNSVNNKDTAVQYIPTSGILPVSNSILVYGCSDGAMRFHNMVPAMLYSSKSSMSSTSTMSVSSGSSVSSVKSSKQNRQSTIKSVRGPNGRNDPVIQLMNVDALYKSKDTTTPFRHDDAIDSLDDSDPSLVTIRSRLITICSSAVIYLWDVVLQLDRASGTVRDLIVHPPLMRLDGLGSMTLSPRRNPPQPKATTPSNKNVAGFWGGITHDTAPFLDVDPAIAYDPQRELLVWTLPAEAPLSAIDHRGDYKVESPSPNSPEAKRDREDYVFLSKWIVRNAGFVKTWDLSVVDAILAANAAASMGNLTSQPPPKLSPVAIMKLPMLLATMESAYGKTVVSSGLTPLSMATGLCHSPLPPASIACVSLTNGGTELIVHAAPLPNATSEYDDHKPQAAPSRNPSSGRNGKEKILFVNAVMCHSVPFANSLRKRGVVTGSLVGSAVLASHLWPDAMAVVTDQGVVIVDLSEGDSWTASKVDESLLRDPKIPKSIQGTRLASTPCSPAGPYHAIISGGPVGGVGNNRPGVLFVEKRSVYASRLGASRASTDRKSSLVEKVDLSPMLLCRLSGRSSPWSVLRSTPTANVVETNVSMMVLPPRLISSPSGRYLSLFWEREKRYEILHAGSLLSREQSANALSSTDGRSPSVDSGGNVVSFAWVGEDDHFAVLRPVDMTVARIEVSPRKASSLVSPAPEIRREALKSFFSPHTNAMSSEGDTGFGNVLDEGRAMPKGKRSRVELRKLAEVQVGAAELAGGVSVAAATTVSLGFVNVRGGDRMVPMALFGGPVLCIACLPMSDSSPLGSRGDEGVAYFYSRKDGAIKENDERASAYVSIGPSMPFPDLVSWDDQGRLCAIAVGCRVAIYLSESPKFTLLGSVLVSGPRSSDADPSLISLKFIHGVVYCTSQTSVYAIFLGNLTDEETVCELDVFVIATDCVPLHDIDAPDDSSPVPVVTSLKYPHILAYYSGGLLVSTSSNIRLLPLSHPILRIGTLLAANLPERARKWIMAAPKSEHDSLAHFLLRRGRADLIFRDLDGLSIELYIDLCMRFERTQELEQLMETHGSQIMREICDWGRGDVNAGYSAIFCIGLYMLNQGKIETAKKMISHSLDTGVNEVLLDAMKLSTLVALADREEGQSLIQQVMDKMKFDSGCRLSLVSIID